MDTEIGAEYIGYITKLCSHYLSSEEVKALRRYAWNSKPYPKGSKAWLKQEMLLGYEDEKTNELFDLGKETLLDKIALRVLEEHGVLIFNYCPNCDKLARTPLAIQCKSCGHDWH